jgi:prepilin-type N-terminal cleavage/methylation domain-containing protein
MKISLSKFRGFTLIELMVTIAIISLLTGIVVTAANPAKQKSRDGKRMSDLSNIQLSLALYFDRCKQFPTTLVTNASNGCPSGITLGSYMSVIPTQPNGGAAYGYTTSGNPPTDYVLSVSLEGYNEALKDDLDDLVYNVNCGTANNGQGTAERIYCLGPK